MAKKHTSSQGQYQDSGAPSHSSEGDGYGASSGRAGSDQIAPALQSRIGLKVNRQGAHARPVITVVDNNSAAAIAGLLPGDQIYSTSLNGETLSITVKREKMRFTAHIELGGQSATIQTNGPNGPTTSNSSNLLANRDADAAGASAQSEKKPFELKAERIDSGATNQTRLLRPGVADQDQTWRPPLTAMANSTQLNADAQALVDPRMFRETPRTDPNIANVPFNLQAQNMEVGTRMQNVPIVDINSPIRVLSNYQIELIVDRSLSMRRRDCPGGLSRWEWCGMQAQDLSRAISPFVPNGLTITPFAGGFDVFRNSSPQNIADVFNHVGFQFGTRLAEPLNNRLTSYFRQREQFKKPLLIAVITDGVPFPQPEPDMVINELVRASHAMRSANDVTVVFFQIGGKDKFGHDYLQYLDQNLVHVGACYHYVHSIPFEQLKVIGLARALVQTVQTFNANR